MWIVDELQNSNIGNFIILVYIHVLYFYYTCIYSCIVLFAF